MFKFLSYKIHINKTFCKDLLPCIQIVKSINYLTQNLKGHIALEVSIHYVNMKFFTIVERIHENNYFRNRFIKPKGILNN